METVAKLLNKRDVLSLALTSNSMKAFCLPLLYNSITLETSIPSQRASNNKDNLIRITNELDSKLLDKILHNNYIKPYIKTIFIELSYSLEAQIGPFAYLDENDISSEDKNEIWAEFLSRCTKITEICKTNNYCKKLIIKLDIDLTTLDSIQQASFIGILNSLLEMNHHSLISLIFSPRCDISPRLSLLWDTLTRIGSRMNSFEILGNAGLWLPSRISAVLLLFKLQKLALIGCRLTESLLGSIKKQEDLVHLDLSYPSFVNEDALDDYLRSTNLKSKQALD